MVPTQADFHSLPTAGPVVWSKAVAQGPKAPMTPSLSTEAQDEINKITAHIIESQLREMLLQILAAVTSTLNLNLQ